MASVPNMRTVPPPAMPGAATPVEGEGGEVFAGLLSIATPGETILDGPGATDRDAPPAFDTQVRPATAGQEIEIDAGLGAPGEGKAAEVEVDADKQDDPAAVLAFTPVTDFLPIVQAQNSYPVAATIVATPVSTPLPTAPVQPAPLAAQPATAALDVEAAPDAQADAKTPDSAPRPPAPVAVSTNKAAETTESEAPELPAPVKAALKAVMVQVKLARTEKESSVPPARMPAVARVETAKEAVTSRVKTAMPAPFQAQIVQTPPRVAPVAIAATIEPVLQPAAVARAAPPMPQPADQAVERELDLAHDSEWLDRLARDIARSGSTDGPMRFRLHPQTLGHLRVELTQSEQGMAVRLTVETEAARAIIADAQPRLMQEARAQGVRIAHAEVDLAGTGHQASGDPRRQEDGRQPAFIRTARGAGLDAAPAAGPGRASSDRYA